MSAALICHICGKRRDEPGELYCSAAHPLESPAAYNRPKAIADVFIACATIIHRDKYASYDAWLSEVNRRFKAAWLVIEP